jgi:hypothetical protein
MTKLTLRSVCAAIASSAAFFSLGMQTLMVFLGHCLCPAGQPPDIV